MNGPRMDGWMVGVNSRRCSSTAAASKEFRGLERESIASIGPWMP